MTRFAGDIFSSYEDPRRPNFSQSAASGMYNQGLVDSAEQMGQYTIESAKNQGQLAIMNAEAQGKIGAMQQDAQNQQGTIGAVGGLVKSFVAPALGGLFGAN